MIHFKKLFFKKFYKKIYDRNFLTPFALNLKYSLLNLDITLSLPKSYYSKKYFTNSAAFH